MLNNECLSKCLPGLVTRVMKHYQKAKCNKKYIHTYFNVFTRVYGRKHFSEISPLCIPVTHF